MKLTRLWNKIIYYAPIWMPLALILGFFGHKVAAEARFIPEEGILPLYRELDSHALLMADISLIRPPGNGLPPKGYLPLEKWLDTLRDMENCPEKGIWDVHSLSFGPYCYKLDTFKRYMAIYGKEVMPYAEPHEYLNNLSDYATQRELTRLIVIDGGWRNWFTSVKVRGLGLPPL